MAGTLSMVATPIGNLADITHRAVEVLREADLVLAEDTRKTRILLNRYTLKTRMQSFHHHTKEAVYERIYEALVEGQAIAFVTDAGTPGVSDPGNLLIDFLVKKGGEGDDFVITPIPGPSAPAALISISGFATDHFTFLGFLPKKGRARVLQSIIDSDHPQLFFESPHRILKTLTELAVLAPDRAIVVGRELTKQFETIYRGTVSEVLQAKGLRLDRGELVVIVSGKKARK